MSENAVPTGEGGQGVVLTANDRFKRSFGTWLSGSMILAVLAHFSVFHFWPELTAEDFSYTAPEIEMYLPPEIEIPPPPEAIARPATPVIATADISEDITIAPTTFEENPVEDLPPPPEQVTTTDISAAPTFTPYTVRPDIKNRPEVTKALENEYPPLLRDAGIGGTVNMWFFIDENGVVQRTQVQDSSGHPALDAAAERVANVFRFTPALNKDKRVPVWISVPITFTTR
jgi:protein TonB